MPARRLAAILIGSLSLAGCTSLDDGSGRSGGDFGGSIGSGFSRSSDTLGTQRRMDVYGGATAPVLPTIGAPGFGK